MPIACLATPVTVRVEPVKSVAIPTVSSTISPVPFTAVVPKSFTEPKKPLGLLYGLVVLVFVFKVSSTDC